MAEMVRLNTRISKTLSDWLDKQTEITGVPKSTIAFLALEQYRQQTEAMTGLNNVGEVMKKLEELEKKIGND